MDSNSIACLRCSRRGFVSRLPVRFPPASTLYLDYRLKFSTIKSAMASGIGDASREARLLPRAILLVVACWYLLVSSNAFFWGAAWVSREGVSAESSNAVCGLRGCCCGPSCGGCCSGNGPASSALNVSKLRNEEDSEPVREGRRRITTLECVGGKPYTSLPAGVNLLADLPDCLSYLLVAQPRDPRADDPWTESQFSPSTPSKVPIWLS